MNSNRITKIIIVILVILLVMCILIPIIQWLMDVFKVAVGIAFIIIILALFLFSGVL